MRQELYQILVNQEMISWQTIIVQILMSAVLGAVIYISYHISHKGTIYSKKFNVSLVLLTLLTGMVMTVIGSNIALSLGMVGALSIVRFRTAIKDSRDTVYIFWAIVAGICCGVGSYLVAAIGTAVVFLVLLFFGNIKNDNRMLLIIRGDRSVEQKIMATVFKLFYRKAVMRVKNTTDHSVEFIYEISNKMLSEADQKEVSVTDSLYAIGNIEYVNIVMQNDEISN
ncbi:MAG TPA: DUF4956 domain-containing protein [Clostridiales bacterium]|nr:DUF4956 domain-containing protein [Clostridiales bacterium]